MSTPSETIKQPSLRKGLETIAKKPDTNDKAGNSKREIAPSTTFHTNRMDSIAGRPSIDDKITSFPQEIQEFRPEARGDNSWNSAKRENSMMGQESYIDDKYGEKFNQENLKGSEEKTTGYEDKESLWESKESKNQQGIQDFQSDDIGAGETENHDFSYETNEEQRVMITHWRMDEHFQKFKRCLMTEIFNAEIAREADRTKKLGQLKARYELLVDGLRLEIGKFRAENDELRMINHQAIKNLQGELKERGKAKAVQKLNSTQFRAFSRWQSWRSAASKLRKTLMRIFRPYITETRFTGQPPSTIDEKMIPESALHGEPAAVKWARKLKQKLPFQVDVQLFPQGRNGAGNLLQPPCKVNLFRFGEWAALVSSGTSILRRASRTWRKQAKEATRRKLEEQVETEKQQAVKDMERQSSAVFAKLKRELDEANQRIAENYRIQKELDTSKKEAFMRGVCAINIEALSMMQTGIKKMEQSKPNDRPSSGLQA